MEFALSFLASRTEQLLALTRCPISCVEAVCFNRDDLEEPTWSEMWGNIARATSLYGPSQVTFHFPVNDADYVADSRVRARLHEAFSRACALGLRGVVVHANRIRTIAGWQKLVLFDQQRYVADALGAVVSSHSASPCWLALENMPIMDNFGREIDPTFVFPRDFAVLEGSGVRIIWDVCHYFSSVATMAAVASGAQRPEYYPNQQATSFFDFETLGTRVAHWHFSAFRGVPNPTTGTQCEEGILPWAGTLPSSLYAFALLTMQRTNGDARCVFEVSETDYLDRQNGREIIAWAYEILAPSHQRAQP